MTLEKIFDMWLSAIITEKRMGLRISMAKGFKFFLMMVIKNKLK